MEQVDGERKAVSNNRKKNSHAPWYRVPKQPIVSVEHPFIIKDVDKGLATLGSRRKLQEVSRLIFKGCPCLRSLSWSKKMALPPVCI